MGRQIEFRGYNLKNKKWLYGYYLFNRGKHFIVQDEVVNPFEEESDFEVDPESVGQFVGVFKSHLSIGTYLDYNYLYEGDLVRATFDNRFYFKYSIRFEPSKSAFVLFLQDNPIRVVDSSLNYKVIGNEYEEKLKISNP